MFTAISCEIKTRAGYVCFIYVLFYSCISLVQLLLVSFFFEKLVSAEQEAPSIPTLWLIIE